MSARIFIDCTHTYGTLANTGIQRVVRSVLLHADNAARQTGVECVPVAYDGEHFHRVDVAALREPRQPTRRDSFIEFARIAYQRARQAVHRVLPFKSVHRFLFAPRHAFGLTYLLHLPFRIASRTRLMGSSESDRVLFDDNSILLMLDAPVGLDPWKSVRSAKEDGTFVIGTIYDLLPVKLPELFLPSLRRAFDDWIHNAIRESDALVTISDAMRSELEAFIRRDSSRPPLPVARFSLGFELDRSETSGEVRQELAQSLESSAAPVFLTVGTIEPRKNHLTIIAGFSRLWNSGVDIRLVVIGAVGWKCERVTDAITHHSEFNRRLFWFKDLSDAELAYCYERARCVVAASLAEGSGLPLIEALARGLPVVASDIAVFREVGGTTARYFPVGDDAALAQQLRAALTHRQPDADAAVRPGWRDCTKELLERVVELRDRGRASKFLGGRVHLSESSGLAA